MFAQNFYPLCGDRLLNGDIQNLNWVSDSNYFGIIFKLNEMFIQRNIFSR